MFSLLKNDRHAIVVAPYFIPWCVPGEFIAMFDIFSKELSGDSRRACLSTFHVQQWYSQCNPSDQDIISLLNIVLESVSVLEDSSGTSFDIYLLVFKDILSLPISNIRIISIRKILKKLVFGTISGRILRY